MGLLEKDKRKFTVIIGSKKCGVCCGAGPSLAAKKVNGKSGAFYLKETTKGSQKKLYGPYSSKKRVVQRGGLRMELCEILINFFLRCPVYIDKRLDDSYKSIENAFKLLGISIFDPQRYIKLKYLIFLRNGYDIGISFFKLLCSESSEIPENQLDNEVTFIINSRDIIGMSSLNIDQWINFIRHFKRQLKNMEIRNQICLYIIYALNNCENPHVSSISVLLPQLYDILKIPHNSNSCEILKDILKLRNDYIISGQSFNLLDILFNIDENLGIDTLFIDTNFREINLLLHKSLKKQEMINMWHAIIIAIRKRIGELVKEQKEHINAREQQSTNMIKRMQQSLQKAKAKEEKNPAIINKMEKELEEEAKESFPQNSLERLNNNNNGNSELPPSFLLSSQRNGKKPTIPSYLLMSTIPNREHAKGGPANLNNNALRRAMLEQQNPNGGPANQTQSSYSSNSSIISYSRPKNFMMQTIRPQRRNLQPKQELHNNQLNGMSNLEARLAALKND